MARILATMAMLFLILPAGGKAQEFAASELTDMDRRAIRSVIERQLTALEHDDGELAFSYASPLLQRQFRNPERFLDVVKNEYPAVYHPRDVQFRALDATFDGPVQTVFLFGPDGEPVLALYYMQQQPDGGWKINGCALAAAPDIGI